MKLIKGDRVRDCIGNFGTVLSINPPPEVTVQFDDGRICNKKPHSLVFVRREHKEKPKFKVGDRVKIDWSRTLYSNYNYDKYGTICKVDDNGAEQAYEVNKIKGCSQSLYFLKKDITLIKSKPEYKFKVGDEVYFKYKNGCSHKGEITNLNCVVDGEQTYNIKSNAEKYKIILKESELQLAETIFKAEDGFMIPMGDNKEHKFLVGTTVVADLVSLGWKIEGCPEEHEAIIKNIEDGFIYIKLLRDGEYEAHFPINLANEYIKYPEKKKELHTITEWCKIFEQKQKKEKWSVGTYVEFLKDYELSNGDVVPNGFYEITDFRKELDVIDIDLKFPFGIYVFDIKRFRIGKIKWHENKPEEKVSVLPNKGEGVDDVVNRIKQHGLLWSTSKTNEEIDGNLGYKSHPVVQEDIDFNPYLREEMWDKVAASKMFELDKKMEKECACSDFGKDYIKSTKGIWKWIDEQTKSAVYYSGMYQPHNILQKPEITISKVKEIDIDINKPKI